MPDADTRYDFDRVVRLLFTAGLVVALFWLVRELSDILLPFAVAAVLAYLLNPIVTLLERRIGQRWPAVLLTIVGLLVLLVTLAVVLVPLIGAELGRFDGIISQLKSSGTAFAERLQKSVKHPVDARMAWLVEQVREFLVSEDFKTLIAGAAKRAVPTAWGLVAGALKTLLALTAVILVLVYLIFLLVDYRLFAKSWKQYLPPAYKDAILDFVGEFQKAMQRYFRGQFIVACITGVCYAIGFKIIGLPLGVALGLLIGVLNMVPYLQSIAFVPACILGVVRAIDHQSSIVVSLLLVVAVFACAQTIMDGFLGPRILGEATGLRPIIIMLSIFIWGRLLGFFGLVLAIPLTCLGLAYYRRFVLKKVELPEPGGVH